MKIQIPELSFVMLIGASGSGKSSFARRWFQPWEITSSDTCRAMVSDDENSMDASGDAFDLLYYIIAKRLKRGMLTVVDATNVYPEDRAKLLQIAKEYHVIPVAIVLNMRDRVCIERSRQRTDRNITPRVIANQVSRLRQGLSKLKYEGFRYIHEFRTPEEVAGLEEISRQPLWNNKKAETGPFDIIGDVHGCYEELSALLIKLGHIPDAATHQVEVANGRKLVFLGDLVDRGPASPDVLKLVMNAVKAGVALCVPGNHDYKLFRWLKGSNVQVTHGLELTIAQLEKESPEFREEVKVFLDGLVSHYVLDGGRLVVAHAGLKEVMQGRGAAAVREFCLYGETTGETDEFGLPVRYNWAAEYRGKARVVYGHTPVSYPEWYNNTIDIDTGCVFGGSLTALRYPENDLVSVKAAKEYAVSKRPIAVPEQALTLQQAHDGLLDVEVLTGKQVIHTRLLENITIREGNAAAALEQLNRFAVNPKWLIYLPPTMSPAETSRLPGYLEHPAEAWQYYREQGINTVICEEKHMGSRAVVIVCRNAAVVKERFGIEEPGIGVCYTRTGRPFFHDTATEQQFLQSVQTVLTERGFWEQFSTDWVCLDAELMPWSAKAMSLIHKQYAATGAAARNGLQQAVEALQKASGNAATEPLLADYSERAAMSIQFTAAYGRYCREVNAVSDYTLAPFHILATEGTTWLHQTHEWHMQQLAVYCGGEGNPMLATAYSIVELDNEQSMQKAEEWWHTLTGKGGEGMVVKPLNFVAKGNKGLVQPAIKIRGVEYLRIIYGAEYTRDENLIRLKKRGLQAKRSMAIKEFALGVEALESFVAKAPLRVTYQNVSGIMAMESEPVDPRL